MLTSIVTALDQLIELQKELISYADRKKTLLIDRKIDELNQLVQEETSLVKHINKKENERVELVERLLQGHPSLTFNQFVDQLDDEEMKKKILGQKQTLQTCMDELQAQNKVNETLLNDSLTFVNQMINQVTRSKKQQFNYQSPLGRQKSPTSSQGFFDTKA